MGFYPPKSRSGLRVVVAEEGNPILVAVVAQAADMPAQSSVDLGVVVLTCRSGPVARQGLILAGLVALEAIPGLEPAVRCWRRAVLAQPASPARRP